MADIEKTLLDVNAEDGVEIETTSSGDEIIEPFDPTKIRVLTQTLTIDLLLKRIRDGIALDLSPDFQRAASIWTNEAQSRLIESILIRIPIPAFYIDATDEDHWSVVDGLQRLTALDRFVIKQDLPLTGLEFLTQFHNYKYDDLPPRYQRRIDETSVVVYLIDQGTPANVKFNIFRRINTGGLPLSAQEIRHALNQGPITTLLSELAKSPDFLRATGYGVNDKRMTDRELVLRFLAFWQTSYTNYLVSDFDTFLNRATTTLNKSESLYPELKQIFLMAMQRAVKIFDDDAFRKRYQRDVARSPINKALFEAWSVNLGKLKEAEFEKLLSKKDELIDKFINLMNQTDFNNAISQGTGNKNKVQIRFSRIETIIKEIVQ
jgi:hypothetical protein